MRLAIVAALLAGGLAIGAAFALGGGTRNAYDVQRLVSDRQGRAAHVRRAAGERVGARCEPDRAVVDGERGELDEHAVLGRRTQAAADGAGRRRPDRRRVVRRQAASGHGRRCLRPRALRLRLRGREAARLDADRAEGVVDPVRSGGRRGRQAAVFRGVAIDGSRVFATDFHNARVNVYDAQWHRLRLPGAFVDESIPAWYAPFGIQAIDGHVFVTYVYRAPVNGNDAPTVATSTSSTVTAGLSPGSQHAGVLNAPWGLAQAPRSFGRFGGDLLDRELRRRPHQRLSPNLRTAGRTPER